MSMNDTVADMLTRIRNGIQVRRPDVEIIGSRVNRAIAEVLVSEGFVTELLLLLCLRGLELCVDVFIVLFESDAFGVESGLVDLVLLLLLRIGGFYLHAFIGDGLP